MASKLSFILLAAFAICGTASASNTGNLRGLASGRNSGGNDRAHSQCYRCSDGDSNPCLDVGADQYHKHCDSNKFIQCAGTKCYDMDCAPGTMWDQEELTCIHSKPLKERGANPKKQSTKHSKSGSDSGSDDRSHHSQCYRCSDGDNNPCLDGGADQYHKHCDSNKFIQCAGTKCYDMDCALGTIWDQEELTCIHSKPLKERGANPKKQSTKHSKPGIHSSGNDRSHHSQCYRCSDGDNNPCLDGGDDQYHKHCDSNKFIQCAGTKCYDMDCAPGTMWDQEELTCIHSKPLKEREANSKKHSKNPSEKGRQSRQKAETKGSSKGDREENMGLCGSCEENPCTEEAIEAGEFYHKHCSQNKKFLQCGDVAGMCYEMDCAPGTVWRQSKQTCVAK